jgi:flagellar protein FlaG
MDTVNSQIGQNIAREQATVLNEKSFNSSNLIGMQTGASQFTRSENPALTQQARNIDKRVSQLPQDVTEEQKKLKNSDDRADSLIREESFDLSESLGGLGDFLQKNGTALSFSIDEASDRQVVTVKDAASGDVIRQIPSEEVLNFAQRIAELQSAIGNQVGVLINRQA